MNRDTIFCDTYNGSFALQHNNDVFLTLKIHYNTILGNIDKYLLNSYI